MYKQPLNQPAAETIVWALSSNRVADERKTVRKPAWSLPQVASFGRGGSPLPLTRAFRPDWPQALKRISWQGRLLSGGVLSSANFKLSALAVLAGFCLLAPGTACAEPISNANVTILGPNVYVFDTNMANADIQGVLNNVYNQMETAQFAAQGYALLFKPGTYYVNCNVGFYTQVAGLGQNPDDVLVNGGVNVNAQWFNGEALNNFWRTEENFAVLPTASDTNTDTFPGITRIAVSQAAPIRRLHVKGELDLYDLWPSCHCGAGYASGGFLADSVVDGNVVPASQQQWLSRNSTWANWNNAVWNMVFVGCQNAPAGNFPNPAYTVVDQTPVIREKPYLYVDGSGNFAVFVPALQHNTSGVSWANGSTPGTSIPISQFYIAQPLTDTAASLNAALAAGNNILFTPGTYSLNGTLQVNNPNTILLGLGVPSLRAMAGLPVLAVADVDGVTIAGLIIDAGPVDSPVLLQLGSNGSLADHSANPTFLYDLVVRTGGWGAAQNDVGVVINSGNVVVDNIWIWRADHSYGVGWTTNPTKNGLIVNGNNVTCYGLFNEHHEQYQTLWNGNGGRVYMYQSEIPYDIPNQTSWMNGGVDGYASYKVANSVTNHEAWGVGIYCYFRDAVVTLNSAIEAPNIPGVNLHHLTTVWLDGQSGSEIAHIINKLGASATIDQRVQTLTDFIGTTNPPPTPVGLSATAGDARVILSWTASLGAVSYNVKRSTSSGTETTIANVSAANYTDRQVNNGATYYYQVSALNEYGQSANSAETNATPQQFPRATVLVDFDSGDPNDNTVSPDADGHYWNNVLAGQTGTGPVQLNGSTRPIALANATNGNSAMMLGITNINYWNGPGANWLDYYGPYPAAVVNFTNTALRDYMAISGVSVTVSGLNPGRTYNVLTYGAGAHSQWGIQGSQTNTLIVGTSPSPASIAFSAVTNSTTVVAWTNVAPSASGQIAFTVMGNAALNFMSVSPTITNALTSTNPPAAPTIQNVTASSGQVSLTWLAVPTATAYNVKRATTSGAETNIASTASTSYIDTSVVGGITYYYKVSGTNYSGEGSLSAEVTATPHSPAVLYQEDWGTTKGGTSVTALADVGWNQVLATDFYSGFFQADGAVDDTTDASLPTNSLWFGDNNPGMALIYTTNGAGRGTYGDSAFTSIDPTQYTNLDLSVYAQWGYNGGALQSWFAVQVGGAWYVSTNHTIIPSQTGGTNYYRTDMIYSPAVTNWNNLTVNSSVAIGGPVASALSGPITGIGLVAKSTGGWWNVNELKVTSVATAPTTLGRITTGGANVSGNSLTLNWTAGASVHLQSASNLVSPVVWTDVSNTTGQGSATISTTNSQMFFRLIQP